MPTDPITVFAGNTLTQAFVDALVALKTSATTSASNAATSEANALASANSAASSLAALNAALENYSAFFGKWGVTPVIVEANGMAAGWTIDDSNGDWDAGGPLYFDNLNLTGDITLDYTSTNLNNVSPLCFMAKYEAATSVDFELAFTTVFLNGSAEEINTVTWKQTPAFGYYVYDEAGAGAEMNQLQFLATQVVVPSGTAQVKIDAVCATSGTSRAVAGVIYIGPGPYFDGT